MLRLKIPRERIIIITWKVNWEKKKTNSITEEEMLKFNDRLSEFMHIYIKNKIVSHLQKVTMEVFFVIPRFLQEDEIYLAISANDRNPKICPEWNKSEPNWE